jgi:hypothetical protein
MSVLHDPFQAFIALLLRAVLVLAGAVFVSSLVVAGVLAGGGVLLWRWLSGRRPVLPRLPDLAEMLGAAFHLRPEGLRPYRRADVVDAEAREIRPTPTALK